MVHKHSGLDIFFIHFFCIYRLLSSGFSHDAGSGQLKAGQDQGEGRQN